MALRLIRTSLTVVYLASAMIALPPTVVGARAGAPAEALLPSLAAFTRSVADGHAGQLRGVYAPGLFADVVLQQPEGDAAFVSSRVDALTEFQLAADLGSVGLLAHNYLAGADFASIQPGQLIYLVYGDGRTARYVTSGVLRYRALQPRSPYSAFTELADGRQITASDLFSDVYGRSRSLVLQTCIEKDGNLTWGRLFIVARPAPLRSPPEFP